jgi:hypothetical protein
MSPNGIGWTQSQKDAFSYIRRGVGEGLTATNALKQYRAGGGAIRDSSWYRLYKETFNQEGWRETVKELPTTYTVTPKMHQETDWDFKEEFVMQMRVSGYSEEIAQRVTKWVTVESDRPLTKAEWRWNAQVAVSDTIGSIPFMIDRFLEYAPLHRVR